LAIYHCNISIGSRSRGQSAIAASAYRSGTKMTDNETGLISDYTKKHGVVFSEVVLCENAPSEYANREILWNAVHKVEKVKNAQLWREFEVALPREFSRTEQIDTVRDFVKILVASGMCADWALHDKGDGNPHAHIMTTMRSIKENGEWAAKSKKVFDLDENGNRIFQCIDSSGRKQYKNHKENYNDWNDQGKVEEWRAAWAECCNARLSESKRIDHRSYERQNINQIPTIHEGYTARKIVAAGGDSDRVNINNEIRKSNILLLRISAQLKALGEQLKTIKGSAFNGRVADLLSRASRAVSGETRRSSERERQITGSDIGTGAADQRQQGTEQQDTAAIIGKARAFIADRAIDLRKSSVIRREVGAFIDDTEAEESAVNAAAELSEKLVGQSGNGSGNIGDEGDDTESQRIKRQLDEAELRIAEIKRQQYLDRIREREEEKRAALERERAAQERKKRSGNHDSR